MMHINTAFTVAVDFSEKDKGVLIVGRQDEKGKMKIINAFEGEEAYELFQKLITMKKKED